jgi:hypothetical protein
VSDDTTQQRRLIIFQPLVYTISYLGEFFFSLCCVRAVILLPDDDDSIPVDSTGNLQEQLSAFSFVVFLFFWVKWEEKKCVHVLSFQLHSRFLKNEVVKVNFWAAFYFTHSVSVTPHRFQFIFFPFNGPIWGLLGYFILWGTPAETAAARDHTSCDEVVNHWG